MKHHLRRIIHYYPELLAKDLDADFMPVVEYLDQAGDPRVVSWRVPSFIACLSPLQAGCRGDDLKLLVWEFPRVRGVFNPSRSVANCQPQLYVVSRHLTSLSQIFGRDFRRHVVKFQFLSVYGLKLERNLSSNEKMMLRVM